MGIQMRKTRRLGPVHLNFTEHGLSSWSLKVGPWSWNSRSRAERVDLPGPFFWRGRGHGRRRTT